MHENSELARLPELLLGEVPLSRHRVDQTLGLPLDGLDRLVIDLTVRAPIGILPPLTLTGLGIELVFTDGTDSGHLASL
jgi:hypothetical protein